MIVLIMIIECIQEMKLNLINYYFKFHNKSFLIFKSFSTDTELLPNLERLRHRTVTLPHRFLRVLTRGLRCGTAKLCSVAATNVLNSVEIL